MQYTGEKSIKVSSKGLKTPVLKLLIKIIQFLNGVWQSDYLSALMLRPYIGNSIKHTNGDS